MANRLLRLTIHDPMVIKALDALRKTRKQSAFVMEALKHYLGTDVGKEQLAFFLISEEVKTTTTPKSEATKPDVKEELAITRASPKNNLDDIFRA